MAGLALAKRDATLGQVVRRKLDAHPIARHDADEMLPHFSGDVRDHRMAAVELHAKPRVGQACVTTPSTSSASSFGFCAIR